MNDLQAIKATLEYQGKKLTVPIRWSVALSKNKKWKWVHRHASVAAGNQNNGKAYPQKS